ncbi:hypothetical protein [Ferrimonas balearica]|uniref:hypothetical protein n=1 Tax=Ferrimonas balearica TaxID=44012 RepID=UPI001C571A94|nr:hypothetical protein [Ferrimonas balearica]MBW3164300.1 hypothetical protein [Ferrimonas balearica]
MVTEQTLTELNQRIELALKGLVDADDEARELLLAQLLDQLELRQQTLTALLQTPLGEDGQWLQAQLSQTQQLASEANQHLSAQRMRLGGYRKGRKQVRTYQQIEAGRG